MMPQKGANMRALFLVLTFGLAALSGCTYERSQQADAARTQLVGFSSAQVSDCMGAPDAKSVLPRAEQWTYLSKASTKLFCKVDVIINNGRVTEIRYSGHTGGLLTENEQCAEIVGRCLPSKPDFSSR